MHQDDVGLHQIKSETIKKLAGFYDYDEQELKQNLRKFQIFIRTEMSTLAPKNLSGCVRVLCDVHETRGLALCLDLYSKLLSAINHAMWIEVWNSLAGMCLGGKKHEMAAKTVSCKLNIKLNGPILGKADLRIPAAHYTLHKARPSKGSKSTEQYQYKEVFPAAHKKYTEEDHNRKRKDSKKKAERFFKLGQFAENDQ